MHFPPDPGRSAARAGRRLLLLLFSMLALLLMVGSAFASSTGIGRGDSSDSPFLKAPLVPTSDYDESILALGDRTSLSAGLRPWVWLAAILRSPTRLRIPDNTFVVPSYYEPLFPVSAAAAAAAPTADSSQDPGAPLFTIGEFAADNVVLLIILSIAALLALFFLILAIVFFPCRSLACCGGADRAQKPYSRSDRIFSLVILAIGSGLIAVFAGLGIASNTFTAEAMGSSLHLSAGVYDHLDAYLPVLNATVEHTPISFGQLASSAFTVAYDPIETFAGQEGLLWIQSREVAAATANFDAQADQVIDQAANFDNAANDFQDVFNRFLDDAAQLDDVQRLNAALVDAYRAPGPGRPWALRGGDAACDLLGVSGTALSTEEAVFAGSDEIEDILIDAIGNNNIEEASSDLTSAIDSNLGDFAGRIQSYGDLVRDSVTSMQEEMAGSYQTFHLNAALPTANTIHSTTDLLMQAKDTYIDPYEPYRSSIVLAVFIVPCVLILLVLATISLRFTLASKVAVILSFIFAAFTWAAFGLHFVLALGASEACDVVDSGEISPIFSDVVGINPDTFTELVHTFESCRQPGDATLLRALSLEHLADFSAPLGATLATVDTFGPDVQRYVDLSATTLALSRLETSAGPVLDALQSTETSQSPLARREAVVGRYRGQVHRLRDQLAASRTLLGLLQAGPGSGTFDRCVILADSTPDAGAAAQIELESLLQRADALTMRFEADVLGPNSDPRPAFSLVEDQSEILDVGLTGLLDATRMAGPQAAAVRAQADHFAATTLPGFVTVQAPVLATTFTQLATDAGVSLQHLAECRWIGQDSLAARNLFCAVTLGALDGLWLSQILFAVSGGVFIAGIVMASIRYSRLVADYEDNEDELELEDGQAGPGGSGAGESYRLQTLRRKSESKKRRKRRRKRSQQRRAAAKADEAIAGGATGALAASPSGSLPSPGSGDLSGASVSAAGLGAKGGKSDGGPARGHDSFSSSFDDDDDEDDDDDDDDSDIDPTRGATTAFDFSDSEDGSLTDVEFDGDEEPERPRPPSAAETFAVATGLPPPPITITPADASSSSAVIIDFSSDLQLNDSSVVDLRSQEAGGFLSISTGGPPGTPGFYSHPSSPGIMRPNTPLAGGFFDFSSTPGTGPPT